ncbi:MAG: hypothetical protein M1822_005138 [Bathelium mastoideum]|nr:MAG: hypothetical protein M1822_005138 [Bathelium mastoideum]
MILSDNDTMKRMAIDIHQTKHTWKVFRALGGFAVLLKNALRSNKVPAAAAPGFITPTPAITFPSAKDIPTIHMETHGPIPVPFELRSGRGPYLSLDWDCWLKQHVRHLLKPDFITGGEWCGYYSHRVISHYDTFDPPMINIRFALSETTNSSQNPLCFAVDGKGRDAIGNFRLLGEVHQDNNIILRKQYTTHQWAWKCTMTPFGMYGNWSSAFDDRQAFGAVWLWKRDWKPF